MEHSKYGPSSSSVWLECAGSVESPEVVEDPGEAAELGTTIHDYVYEATRTGAMPPRPPLADEEAEEVFDLCVQRWLEVVEETAMDLPDGGQMLTEVRMISEVFPEFGGTSDLLIITPTSIHVKDLKTGMGPVSSEDNPQLGCYLLLAKEKFPGRERFFGTIVQPRLNYEHTHEFTAAALAKLRETIAEKYHSTDRSAGGHCKHCPLLPSCQPAFDKARQVLADSLQALPEPAADIPPEIAKWKEFIELLPVAEKLDATGRATVLGYIQAGGKVEGWKAAAHGAKRVWQNERKALEILRAMVPDETDLVDSRLLSPPQVEKLFKKKGLGEIPEGLIYKPPAKTILAKKNSPKTEVTESDASEFFYDDE